MIYNVLGKTGLHVSKIGFGCGPLGNAFGTVGPDAAVRAVHCAVERGINYFDVAPFYGLTLAEKRLGEALAGKRDSIVIATKAGRYGLSLETGFDFSAGRIYRSIDESLSRLKTDYIDLYQLHDIEFGDKKQIINESIPAMVRLKESGKIRYVGITGYPLHILRDVAEVTDIDTILSYCRYNLMDTSMDDVVTPLAKQKGLGLINASPLHQGILTDSGPPDWQFAPKRVKTMGENVARFCRERGTGIIQQAMHFAFGHDYVASTLVGMSSEEEVKENVRFLETKPDMELLTAVREMIKPVANVVWKSGRPENDDPGAEEQKL